VIHHTGMVEPSAMLVTDEGELVDPDEAAPDAAAEEQDAATTDPEEHVNGVSFEFEDEDGDEEDHEGNTGPDGEDEDGNENDTDEQDRK
jgi:hypothetical protein